MNWYIGQEIVALITDKYWFNEGDVLKIEGLRTSPCKCDFVGINIGKFYNATGKISCPNCGTIITVSKEYLFFHEGHLAPLDTLADISELTEILETTKPYDV